MGLLELDHDRAGTCNYNPVGGCSIKTTSVNSCFQLNKELCVRKAFLDGPIVQSASDIPPSYWNCECYALTEFGNLHIPILVYCFEVEGTPLGTVIEM